VEAHTIRTGVPAAAVTLHDPTMTTPPPPSPAAISVSNVAVRHGSVTALDGVTLDVPSGTVIAILGPNGAGKSSLIECLTGYRKPDLGDVRVLGSDPWRAGPRWRARIGAVLQDSRTDADLTVGEYLAMVAGSYGSRAMPVGDAIELLDLTAHVAQRVHRLSGGQRRRVEIAAALVGRPEVLFLDEPTSGLDPQARRALWATIGGLHTAGRTVVLTTHQLDEAEALADRIVVIVGGRILHDGTISDLRRHAALDTVVSWTATQSLDLPGRQVQRTGEHRFEVATSEPAAVVAEVLSAAAAAGGVEIRDLDLRPPSFEDVYLALVDHRQERTR
jgi:ABC-2 type transport system ATP-binding protein